MGQHLLIDPATGDYVLDKGAPVDTDSLQVPAYVRLKAKRETWLYAPDADWGADFYKFKKVTTNEAPSLVENLATSALTPMVNDSRASEITVDTQVVKRGAVGLQVQITDAAGKQETLVLPQIF